MTLLFPRSRYPRMDLSPSLVFAAIEYPETSQPCRVATDLGEHNSLEGHHLERSSPSPSQRGLETG